MEACKKSMFSIFLAVNMLLWSLIAAIRNVPSFDSMEAICWGELASFGTNKHPPLSGWLMSWFYHLFGDNNFVIYLLGQICILISLVFVYKIAKFFVSKEKAMCSAMILEGCYCYTYYYFTDNFNCNIILYPLWVMAIYYFYKSINNNRTIDWILFGAVSGLAFLGKYQIIFLFAAMFLYLLADRRNVFRQKGMYLSVLVGGLLILPHVIWLFQNDFFSFGYMIERTHAHAGNLPVILIKLRHIFFPIKFVVGQVIALAGCLGLYLIIALQAGNIKFKNDEGSKSDKIFLLILFVAPIVLQGLMGFVTGERVPSIWGSIMLGLGGIMLFYFLPINFKETTYKFFVKCIYAAMAVSASITLCVAGLQTNSIMFMPIQKIEKEIIYEWNIKTDSSPLKYVVAGGMIAFPLKHFNSQKPTIVLDTYAHKNPWVDYDDIDKFGAVIVGEAEENVIAKTKEIFVKLPNNYEIKPKKYEMNICNKLDKCEEKNIYYVIIPPKEHNLKIFSKQNDNKFYKFLMMFVNLISN